MEDWRGVVLRRPLASVGIEGIDVIDRPFHGRSVSGTRR